MQRRIGLFNRVSTVVIGVGGFIFVCLIVFAIEQVFGVSFSQCGILPRQMSGLIGILCAPFIHLDQTHLLTNMASLIVLGPVLAMHGRRIFLVATVTILVFGGMGVWLVGSTSYHIGASGLIFGYLGFLLLRGWYVKRFLPIAISLLVAFYFGGALIGIVPGDPKVSWISHFCGFIAGIIAAKWQGAEEREMKEDDT